MESPFSIWKMHRDFHREIFSMKKFLSIQKEQALLRNSRGDLLQKGLSTIHRL